MVDEPGAVGDPTDDEAEKREELSDEEADEIAGGTLAMTAAGGAAESLPLVEGGAAESGD